MVLVAEVAFFHVVAFVRADVAATTPPGRALCAEEHPARYLVHVLGPALALPAGVVHVGKNLFLHSLSPLYCSSWIRLTIVFRVLQYSGVSKACSVSVMLLFTATSTSSTRRPVQNQRRMLPRTTQVPSPRT